MPDFVRLSARYGIATTESFFDLSARRHLMPSVMDSVPPLDQRCACPGPMRTPGNVPCILADTAGDHLCDACRSQCHGENDKHEMVPFIVGFGPAFHISPPRQEPEYEGSHHRGEKVHLSDGVMVDLDHGDVADVTVVEELSAVRADPTLVWAPSPSGKRIHAYEHPSGKWTQPVAACRQSNGTSWEQVRRLALNQATGIPVCKSCTRVINQRDEMES